MALHSQAFLLVLRPDVRNAVGSLAFLGQVGGRGAPAPRTRRGPSAPEAGVQVLWGKVVTDGALTRGQGRALVLRGNSGVGNGAAPLPLSRSRIGGPGGGPAAGDAALGVRLVTLAAVR